MRSYLASLLADVRYGASIFNGAFGEYKFGILALAALSFLSGMLEGIGINSIIPLFSLVQPGASAQITDVISTKVGSVFVYLHIPYTVRTLVIFIAALFLLKAVALFYSNYIAAKITTRFEKKIRSSLVAVTFGADWLYLLKQKVGHLDQLLTTSTLSSSNFLNYVGSVMVSVSNIIVFSILVLSVSTWIAAATALFGILVFFITKPLFRMTRTVAYKVTHIYKEIAHSVNEVLIGIKPIKSMYLQEEASKRSFDYFEDIRVANMKLAMYRNVSAIMFQPISMLFVLGIFLFFYKTSTFNVGSFAVIVYSINKVFSHIQLAQAQLHLINTYVPHTQAILNYTEESKKHQEVSGGTKPFSFEKNIEMKNVSFAYAAGLEPAISGVSFAVEKGETVGIVGPSGGGKTTVTDLLLGLMKPTAGEVSIDGTPLSAFDMRSLRSHIGYVSQEIFLLNDTVENNIRFFNDTMNEADVVGAAKLANCLDFIEELPKKFQTVVGERGVTLSVGQRQRIALARVLARKPSILFLDEATSALDTESEMLIQKAIDNLHGTITVVAIAHRLSTVMSADRIVVIGKGKVIEEGTPFKLLEDPNSYFAKANQQNA